MQRRRYKFLNMANNTATISTFLDIHQHDEENLPIEEYLSEDLVRNWFSAWKNPSANNSNWVQRSANIQARKQLWFRGWVTICGYSGDGRSSIANDLVTYFRQEPPKYTDVVRSGEHLTREFVRTALDDEGRVCYEPVYVRNPGEYRVKVDPNVHQIVVLEDIFGCAGLEWTKIETWRPYLEGMLWDVTIRKPKTLIVISVDKSHLDRAPNDIMQLEWFKPANMIDLQVTDKLTEEEILKMTEFTRQEFHRHLNDNSGESAPLLYRMRNLVTKFKMDGEHFFQNPWEKVLAEIGQIYKVDRIMYYTLAVAVLLDGSLDLSKPHLQDYDGRTRQVMEQLINPLDVPLEVSQSKMRFAAKLLTGFFFWEVGRSHWEVHHHRVYSLCLTSLLNTKPNEVITLLSTDAICKFIRIEKIEKVSDREMIVTVDRSNFEVLAKRFIEGIISGHMEPLVSNMCFQNEEFVDIFFKEIRQTGNLGQLVFQRDKVYGRSLFYWACHYGHGHLVESLLLEDKELNLKNDARFLDEFKLGLIAASASLSPNSCDVVKVLHEHAGVDLHLGNIDKERREVLQILGNDLNYLLSMEASILHVACLKGHHRTVEYLFASGVDMSKKSKDDSSVLHYAASRMDAEGPKIVQLLLNQNARMEAMNGKGYTALDEAVESGCVDSVNLLVTAGADINKGQGNDGPSYLAKAVQRQYRPLITFILTRKPMLNGIQGRDIFPPLCLAVQTGNVSIVDDLLVQNVNLDFPGSNGWTPLHIACYLGNKVITERLIYGNAKVNVQNKDGNTPLHIAAGKGRLAICELLLNKGAKTELMNKNKETPLVCASRGEHSMVTWLLLREGMDL